MNTAILTIDDIASNNTPAIVDYLKSKGITAVMFAVGQNVEKFYDEAIYALRAGMIVGNHSYSHPAFSKLTIEEAIADIEKNEEVLNKLYKDAGVERVYRPFRFPYGDKGGEIASQLQEYFKEKGYDKLDDTKVPYPWWKEGGHDKFIDTFWTFDIEEYRIPWKTEFTVEDVWKKLKDRNPEQGTALIGEEKHHIILLHAHDETEAMVPEYYKQFIDYMLENGMTFEVPEFI
ncbi:MAG: polysaccharide deacetylase family protein [Lachnospiraceae bacterium]|nr:polysaccharide deacetylase family protein [Lachnospiraceae bacterium]